MALEWARNIKQQMDLDTALDINEANILELLEEIRVLKKEKRKLERDNDVLFFELQNWKPQEPAKRTKGGLDLDDPEDELL
jgi:hypothetical protein